MTVPSAAPRAATVPVLVRVVALAAIAALSACSTEDEPSPPTATRLLPGDTTPPGTTLSFGDTATVLRSGSRLEITVRALEKGSPRDLVSLELEDEFKDVTPYYARVHVKPLDAQSLDWNLDSYLYAFSGNRGVGHLSIFSEFPRCQDLTLTSADLTSAYDTCITWYTKPGEAAPDAVIFENNREYVSEQGTEVAWE